jgi:DNA-binding NarL/FixJ family response regulator
MPRPRRKRIQKDHTVPPVFAFDEWRGITEAFALSPRQAQILGLVIQSHKDQDIVDSLKIRKSTVRTHLIETKKRLSAKDRVGMAYRVFVAFRELIEPR